MISVGDARKSPYQMHADLIYLDPPSNLGFNEGGSCDTLLDTVYYQFICDAFRNILSRMATNCWVIVFDRPGHRYFYNFLIKQHFHRLRFHEEIIWNYNFGPYQRHHFVCSHTNISVYRQGDPKFYWKQVAEPSQRMSIDDPRADWRGRVPGSVWSISRVCGTSEERSHFKDTFKRTIHPLQLVNRIIRAYTKAGDTVYDPFMGSGQVARSCFMNHRTYYGLDICEHYVEEVKGLLERIQTLKDLQCSKKK